MTIAARPRPTRRPSRGQADRERGPMHGLRILSEAPAVANDDWLLMMPMGTYEYADYGAIEVTPDRCARFVQNFTDNVRGHALPINREHDKVAGAVGWMQAVKADESGVWMKASWTADGQQLVDAKAFKWLSPEWYPEWQDPKDPTKKFSDVLVGVALTNYPRFYDLPAIAASEARADAKQASESFESLISSVNEALEDLYGWGCYICEDGTYEDHVIVSWQGGFWSFPYTRDADGRVNLGMPTEQRRMYVAASEDSVDTITSALQALGLSGTALKKAKEAGMEPKPVETIKPAAAPSPTGDDAPITASEATLLRKQIADSRAEVRVIKANEALTKAVADGRIVPAQVDGYLERMVTASDTEFTWMAEDLAKRPKVIELGAIGGGGAVTTGEDDTARTATLEKAKVVMSEAAQGGHPITLREALLRVAGKVA